MALDVRYGEIRSEVIAKLETQKGEMENLLDKLSNTVETLPSVMEGQALQAYMDEYEKIVKTIYSKLNVNLGDFSQQLESVCQQFENLDDDMTTTVSSLVSNGYMEAESATAYVEEFKNMLGPDIESLSELINQFYTQLSQICQNFAEADANIADMLF